MVLLERKYKPKLSFFREEEYTSNVAPSVAVIAAMIAVSIAILSGSINHHHIQPMFPMGGGGHSVK